MLTHGVLHAQLASALAKLRHTDTFVVADCGLPVPKGIEVIDLALTFGIPRFTQVLDLLQSTLVLEGATMSCEVKNTAAQQWVVERFGQLPIEYLPHDGPQGFKAQIAHASFVIRTGETTPYANVILRSSVPF